MSLHIWPKLCRVNLSVHGRRGGGLWMQTTRQCVFISAEKCVPLWWEMSIVGGGACMCGEEGTLPIVLWTKLCSKKKKVYKKSKNTSPPRVRDVQLPSKKSDGRLKEWGTLSLFFLFLISENHLHAYEQSSKKNNLWPWASNLNLVSSLRTRHGSGWCQYVISFLALNSCSSGAMSANSGPRVQSSRTPVFVNTVLLERSRARLTGRRCDSGRVR